ncbi:STAS domain-containing protein [Streptomyces sp. NPDC047461]|uniref:STAS domain-containing protein n=1 Tax=Streptomyces sp. NPDC047461 TaxID=3155619 RepID=UPI00340FD091
MAVSGEMDHLAAARLDDALLAAAVSGARYIEVDFSQVRFCDCAGLNVLRFVMFGPVAPAVERLLELTGTGPLGDSCLPPNGARAEGVTRAVPRTL